MAGVGWTLQRVSQSAPRPRGVRSASPESIRGTRARGVHPAGCGLEEPEESTGLCGALGGLNYVLALAASAPSCRWDAAERLFNVSSTSSPGGHSALAATNAMAHCVLRGVRARTLAQGFVPPLEARLLAAVLPLLSPPAVVDRSYCRALGGRAQAPMPACGLEAPCDRPPAGLRGGEQGVPVEWPGTEGASPRTVPNPT
jgi:hypothetical protein